MSKIIAGIKTEREPKICEAILSFLKTIQARIRLKAEINKVAIARLKSVFLLPIISWKIKKHPSGTKNIISKKIAFKNRRAKIA